MTARFSCSRSFHLLSRLRSLVLDRSGIALTEFAISLPVILGVGAYGVEIANYTMINLRISQIALNLADDASRVGTTSGLSSQQMREVDVNDVLQGARYQGSAFNLTANGRITLSSLENVRQSYDTSAVQRIHWQRCIGLKSGTGYDSSYGVTLASDGTTASSSDAGTVLPDGMGPTDSQVDAPTDSGVMYVEINYDYQPLFGNWLLQPKVIHYTASFIVRDKRDFSMIYNPAPTASASTCNKYTI